MKNRKRKNSLKGIQKLDAKTFLSCYYGISSKDVEHMTHLVMSEFFPQLKRTNFSFVQKNPELISRGQIVLVEDSKHKEAPYWKPKQSILDDLFSICDDRERVIQKIMNFLKKSIANNLETLFIVEVEKELDSYLYKKEKLADNFLSEKITEERLNLNSIEKTGIVIKRDYSSFGYKILNHGDNYYSTFALPPLQRQAVGISRKTDAFAVLYEEGKLLLAVDGILKDIPDEYALHKALMLLFPLPETEKAKEDSENLFAVPDVKNYSLKEMSNYELEHLMNVYRVSNQMAYYHVVRRELIRRTENSKNYRIRKEKEKFKELEKGD